MKFTIIIPCYNSADTVHKAINSITSQNVSKYEIICINDGSKDNTLNSIKKLSAQNINIKVIDNGENKGVSFSRNTGIAAAEGDYILFLDADDIYLDGLFDNLNEVVLNYKPDIISFGFSRAGGAGKKEKTYSNSNLIGLHKGEGFLKAFLKRDVFQSICTVCIKNDFLIKNEIIFNEKIALGEDLAFQIKAMVSSKTIFYMPNLFFQYEYNPNSVSNVTYGHKHLSCIENYFDVINFFDKDNDLKKYLSFYYQFLFFYELRYFSKSEEGVLNYYLASDSILKKKTPFFINKSSIQLFFIKFVYFLNKRKLISLFKRGQ